MPSRSGRLKVVLLDVTDVARIIAALHDAEPIGVPVNNAGIGLLSALGGTSTATAREIFGQGDRWARESRVAPFRPTVKATRDRTKEDKP